MRRFADLIFAMRPMLIPPVWIVALLGYWCGWRTHSDATFWWPILWDGLGTLWMAPRLWGLLGVTTLLAGGIYIVNQLFDLEGDRHNGKLFVFAQGLLSRPVGAWQCLIVDVAAIVGAFFLGSMTGWLMVAGVLLGVAYSMPPFSLKDRPYAGWLTNMIGHGSLTFLIGWSVAGTDYHLAFMQSIPYFFAIGAIYLATTIPDHQGDLLVHKETVTVRLGERWTLRLALACTIVAAVTSGAAGDWALFFPATVVLVGFAISFRRPLEFVLRVIRLSVLLMGLTAAIVWWPFALVLILTVVATRVYYKKRFGVVFPKF